MVLADGERQERKRPKPRDGVPALVLIGMFFARFDLLIIGQEVPRLKRSYLFGVDAGTGSRRVLAVDDGMDLGPAGPRHGVVPAGGRAVAAALGGDAGTGGEAGRRAGTPIQAAE